jgi:CRP-like cAMP-binding protein
MNPNESLRKFALNYVSLTDAEFDHVYSFFELRTIKKKEKLTKEGEVEKYANFIESGLARLFFTKEKKEIIMQFSKENDVICCYESYLTGKPSKFTTQAVEPMVVLSITHENLEKIFEYSPKIERLGRLFARDEYIRNADFDYNRLRVNSQERFINFMQNNGDLIQRVSQKYIASYLNIKPETFSRLKHLLKKKPVTI